MRFSRLAHTLTAITLLTTGAAWAADRPAPASDLPAPEAHPVVNVRAALGQNIHELSVDAVTFGRVVQFLRDVSGSNIVVNWKILEAAGVSKETPITLNVRELTLRKMLQLVLDQASPATQLTFTTDSNVLEITTQEEADKKLITKVYVVDDLVIPDNTTSKPPTFDLNQITNSGTTTGGGGGSSGSGGGGLFTPDTSNTTTPEQTREKRGEELVTLIREIVRPQIWKENGGPGSIKYFSGKLIITAPASVHEAIGGPVGNDAQRFGM